MKHEGQIIKKAITEIGMPITVLTKKLGKSRGWFYGIFNSSSVSIDKILKISKAINYDFSNDIPKLEKTLRSFEEPPVPYNKKGKELPSTWKEKYLTLLEEHNQLLKEYNKIVLRKGEK